jgi:hypothetical protein
MIVNIVDKRSCKYDVECDAIFEAAAADNSCSGATQFKLDTKLVYEHLLYTTVAKAIKFGNLRKGSITVFLYNEGSVTPDSKNEIKKAKALKKLRRKS